MPDQNPHYFTSIIVASYNRSDIICECVDALIAQDCEPETFEIIVVDNNSSDNTVELIQQTFPELLQSKKLKLLALDYNSGSSGSYVQALSAINPDWDFVLKMDEDMVLDSSCLREMVLTATQNNKVGMVGGKCFFYKEPEKLQTIGARFKTYFTIARSIGKNDLNHSAFDKECLIDGVSGSMFLISRQIFNEVGWFDEDYFLYYDDHDLMYKGLQAGFFNYFTPKAIGYHDTSTADFGKFRNPQWLYYSSRGGWFFLKKNFSSASLNYMIYLLSYCAKSLLILLLILLGRTGSLIISLRAFAAGHKHGILSSNKGYFDINQFKKVK